MISMVRMVRSIAAGILVIATGIVAGGCAQTNVQQADATIRYIPESELVTKSWQADPSARGIGAVEVRDGRTADQYTGHRFGEKDGSTALITFVNGVDPWVEEGVRENLGAAGVRFDEAGGPTLRVRVDEMTIEENVAVQASYDGRMVVTFEVVEPSGQTSWTQRGVGAARNWGKPASATNYSETLSHALERAIVSAFGDGELQRALKRR